MKIGFFYVGPNNSEHAVLARNMIKSAKAAMPNVPLVHLTDEKTEAFDGVDETRRKPKTDLAVFRMLHEAECEGEWLFVDTDIVFNRDVSEVFDDKSFQVALTNRGEPVDWSRSMPFNLGVAFSRCPAFFAEAARQTAALSDENKRFMGDQIAICDMVRQGNWSVKIVPGALYNFTPLDPEDKRKDEAAIVHYKGARKKWLKLEGMP